MEKEIDKTNIEDDSSLKFVKEVAKYFMNYEFFRYRL